MFYFMFIPFVNIFKNIGTWFPTKLKILDAHIYKTYGYAMFPYVPIFLGVFL